MTDHVLLAVASLVSAYSLSMTLSKSVENGTRANSAWSMAFM